MEIALIIAVVLAGAGTAVQAGMNAQLRESLGHTLTASTLNFTIGLLSLVVLLIGLRVPLPAPSSIIQVPVWAWLGGVIGAAFVATVAVASRDLGMLLTLGLIISGQIFGSMIIDHFGWVGFSARPINSMKLVGALLLLIGVVIIKRA